MSVRDTNFSPLESRRRVQLYLFCNIVFLKYIQREQIKRQIIGKRREKLNFLFYGEPIFKSAVPAYYETVSQCCTSEGLHMMLLN